MVGQNRAAIGACDAAQPLLVYSARTRTKCSLNVTAHISLRKPNLLALVKQHKPHPIYAIDNLLGDHGHTVVRLPPYHCDLNPIELIWAMAKKKVSAHNVGTRDAKVLTEEAFSSITTENWKNCCQHVKKNEKHYFELRRTLYKDIDDLIIRVESDTSSSCY